MTLLPEQREALIDSLFEWRINGLTGNFTAAMDFIEDVLMNGREGYCEMDDDELLRCAEDYEMYDRLEELGITVEG